ncbi:hypothetical protein F0562_028581 [Nyssa sinensis]|uniref:Protein kinase domain-containing protein n=1 Tax=Nyssa sinensis TaxID=561372 RepID=A0A5J5AYK8_9ASTE|nr:hypothetical protein F0562_028581 [Nyssa sinensis]
MVDRRITIALVILFLLFEFTIEQLVPLSSHSERAAIIQLRSSLGLRAREWPIKGDPCLLWMGVQCQNGRIVGINISGFKRTRIDNRLAGIIPSRLDQLLRLLVLDLSRNSLTGSIPSFASLRNLTFLDMSLNFLSGTIPPAIGTLSKLKFLNFSNNSLSSSIPAQLGDLSNLVDLDLSFNSLSGSVPSDLRGLRNLQKILIGHNFLAGALPNNLFPALTQLQFVVLNHNNFTGDLPDIFWSMSELHFLDASCNNFTGILPNLSLNANATTAVFNLSQNMFYGILTSILRRFSFIDLSGNYFEGRVPYYVRSNASLDRNCLQNVSNQRIVAECTSFYAERGLTFDNFGFPNATPPVPSWEEPQKRDHIGRSFGGPWVYCTSGDCSGDFNDVNLIRHGHSGDLFRGILEDGIPVVIKRIDLRSVNNEVYMLELDFFSKVSHARLVPLLGHCLENENEKFLVYKYMPNGDLSSSLYRKTNSENDSLQSLDWITRLKIATGAAEGLSYLHHECTPPLVHRDVQASSILLDDKFEVRLGSLSEVCAQEGDTPQNMITRFLRLPQTSEQGTSGSPTATCAYDVFCFGKVLLVLVTGKLGISASGDAAMKDWLEEILPYISIYDKELVTNIVDPSLIIDEDLLEEVWAMAIVARSCLNPKPSRRPLMRYILKALENPLKVVREEHTSSERLRTTSSRGYWNTALFGSWRHSTSDVAAQTNKDEGVSGFKQAGTTGSQGSGQHGGGDHSSPTRRQSKEIFAEPSEGQDIERQDED